MREAQLAGHDVGELIDRVTADSLDGARSISSVLHSRLDGLGLAPQHDPTWAQRTPDGVPDLARELADGLDARGRELGVRHADRPEPWLAGSRLGVLGPDASPALRADYERRAGIAASYREAAGITNPEQAISPDPHEGNPELETARRATIRALEMRDEAEFLHGLTRGQLEARVAAGERAMAAAPPDVSADLRQTGQARRDAWGQNADAQARGAEQEAANAAQLARLMEVRQARLQPQAAAYEQWSARTAQARHDAGKAREELARRGPPETPPPGGGGGPGDGGGPGGSGGPETNSELEWWRQFGADLEAVDRALTAQRQAALDKGQPWPPRPEPGEAEREAVAAEADRLLDQLRADGLLTPEPEPERVPEAAPGPAPEEAAVPAPAGLETAEPAGPPTSVDPPAATSSDPAGSVDPPAPAQQPDAPAPRRVPDELPERLPRSDAEWRLDNAKLDREAAGRAAREAAAQAVADPEPVTEPAPVENSSASARLGRSRSKMRRHWAARFPSSHSAPGWLAQQRARV
jgi:hypothetical protein